VPRPVNGGQWRYVYRAIDQFGQVIDVFVSERRDTKAARRLFEHAIGSTRVLDAVRAPVGDPGAFPPRQTVNDVLRAWLLVIAPAANPERRGRTNPRQAKRSLSYPAKAADPARRPKPRGG